MSAKYEIVTKKFTDIRLKSATIAVRKEGMNAIFMKGVERKQHTPVACAIACPRKTIISRAQSATIKMQAYKQHIEHQIFQLYPCTKLIHVCQISYGHITSDTTATPPEIKSISATWMSSVPLEIDG